MLELVMITFDMVEHPAFVFQSFDNVFTVHEYTLYTRKQEAQRLRVRRSALVNASISRRVSGRLH